jgi:hypothetical protein
VSERLVTAEVPLSADVVTFLESTARLYAAEATGS